MTVISTHFLLPTPHSTALKQASIPTAVDDTGRSPLRNCLLVIVLGLLLTSFSLALLACWMIFCVVFNNEAKFEVSALDSIEQWATYLMEP